MSVNVKQLKRCDIDIKTVADTNRVFINNDHSNRTVSGTIDGRQGVEVLDETRTAATHSYFINNKTELIKRVLSPRTSRRTF